MKYYRYYMPDCDHTYELLQAHTSTDVFSGSLKMAADYVTDQDKKKLLKTPFHVLQKEAAELLKYYETNPQVLAILNFDTDIAPFASDVTTWFLACKTQDANSQEAKKMNGLFTHYILKGGNVEVIRRYLAEQEVKIKASNLSIKKRLLKDISYFEGMLEIETPYDKLYEKAGCFVKTKTTSIITELQQEMTEFDPYLVTEIVNDRIATLVSLNAGDPYYFDGLHRLSIAAMLMQEEAESE